MPSKTAAAISSSTSRVIRLVLDVAAAGFVLCVTGAAVTSGLGDSNSAPRGDGEVVATGRGESDGAGITVTTADGDDRRDLLGEGAGGGGLGDGLAAVRLGDGSGGGGITLDGELEASTRAGVLLGEGLLVAVGFGEGAGAASADAPSSTTGTTATAARPSSSGRRTSGT